MRAMRDDAFSKLLDINFALDTDLVCEIFATVHRVDPRDVEYVNRLLPQLAQYLPYELGWIIRSDISLEEGRQRATRVASRYGRYVQLLQPFLGYLKFQGIGQLTSVLQQVDDACSDYLHNSAAGRKDANTRRLIDRNIRLARALDEAAIQLEQAERDIEPDFSRAVEAYNRVVRRDGEPLSSSAFSLSTVMRLAQGATELATSDLRHDPKRGSYVPGNQVKMEIVEVAYHLACGYGGPPFVTTPGSDFSMFASLLFEMASGKRKESMAGTIRRFALGEEKREIDEYLVEYGPDHDERQLSDNFQSIRERAERAFGEVKRYQAIAEREDLSKYARWVCHLRLEDYVKEAEELLSTSGPFLVWASQISDADQARSWAEFLRHGEQQRLQDIELGEQRRKASGLT